MQEFFHTLTINGRSGITVTGVGLKITGFSKTSGTFSASGAVGGVRYGGQGLKSKIFR